MTRTWNTRATSVRGALFLLLGVYVGGFVGMVVLGCGKQVLGVRAAKTTTTIERVWEFGVLNFLFDFTCLRSLPMRDRARAMRPARYVGPAGKERF